jgi:FixJ family two-component response regulator
VHIIDDDETVRDGIAMLLSSVDIAVKVYSSGEEFLHSDVPECPSCVVLDVRLRGMSGLALQQSIKTRLGLPVIFVSAHGDVEMTARAMKAGAIDFLSKPFRGQDMLDAVTAAIEVDCTRRRQESAIAALVSCYEQLTTREREVMALVAGGAHNKKIALQLELSEVTIKLHRGNAMKKMRSMSFAHFVLQAHALGLASLDPLLVTT